MIKQQAYNQLRMMTSSNDFAMIPYPDRIVGLDRDQLVREGYLSVKRVKWTGRMSRNIYSFTAKALKLLAQYSIRAKRRTKVVDSFDITLRGWGHYASKASGDQLSVSKRRKKRK